MKLRIALLAAFAILFQFATKAQGYSFSCTRDTTVSSCVVPVCFPLSTRVPDIHAQSDDYEVVQIAGAGAAPGSCFTPYVAPNDPNGTSSSLTIDDRYSSVINLGFNFKFWGISYDKVVISTNGLISFNTSLSGAFSHWGANSTGGAVGGTGSPVDLPSTLYDANLIMGPYHDLLPGNSSSPDQKIQYQILGTAPYRRFVFSFYKVPLFQCTSSIENTHQIVLYETTNIIEVFVFSKQVCTGWNQGRAMIGLQNATKDKGIMAPGRKASDGPWGTPNMNEAWRFIPKAGASLLNRVEVLNSTGTVMTTGVAGTSSAGLTPVTFPNFCVPVSSTSNYIIRAVYNDPNSPGNFNYGLDTFRVTIVSGIAATTTVVPAGCLPTGSITVNVTAGTGTPPYTYQLDNNPPQSSNVFSNLAAGTYTITVKDATGCTNVMQVTVAAINPLQATATTTPAACSPTGSITVTVTPGTGTGPYTYSLDNGPAQPSNIFTGVAGGTHTVTVTDVTTTCVRPVTAIISNVNNLAGTVTSTPSGCTPTGSVTVNATLGTPPYTYSIDNGPFQTSPSFFPVGVGLHTIVIKDASTCTKTINAIVSSLPKPTIASAPVTNSGCTPSGSITINLNAGSGVAPFTYVLNPGAVSQSTNVFTGLAAGTYSVTVTDAVGCSVTRSNLVITASAAMTASAVATPSGCTPSGTITVSQTGGTAPYQYSLNNGTPQSSNVFSGLNPGTYNIVVADASGCSATTTATVASTGSLTATGTTTPSGCSPASGTISITVPAGSGVAPYTYSLDNATPVSTSTFTGVTAGNHTVQVKDFAGCSYTVSVTVGSTPPPTLSLAGTASGCSAIGTITATASAGTAPFTYTLDTGTPQPNNVFYAVAAGVHTVTVTDSKGCTATATYTTATHPALAATIASTPSGCAPPSGTITVTVTGGTLLGPGTFTLDSNPPQSTGVFTGIASGPHTVVVTDSSGCTVTLTTTVQAPPALAGTATSTASGCTPPSGTVTVTMSNGVAPYTYTLDSGTPQASGNFTGVTAGAHNVSVVDAQGCTVTIPVTVAAPAPLSASATTTASGCNPTGTITVTMAAGSGVAPFTYSLNSGLPQASNTFNNVATGTHNVTVTDAQGCTTSVTANVGALPALTATATTTASGCSPSGTITVTVPAGIGVAPLTYALDAGAPQTGNVFTSVTDGTHNVTVNDASGCTYSFTATVAGPTPLTATVATATTSCGGAANGTATLTPTNGIAPYEYQIGTSGWQSSATFNNLAVGSYNLYFRDASGCVSGAFQAVVTAGPAITATETHINVSCFGGSNGSATLTLSSNATAPFTFTSDNFATSQSSSTLTGLTAGSHTLSFRDAVGCSNTITVTITEPTQLVAGTPTSVSPICNGAANGSVTFTASGGTAPYTYSFNNGPFINSATFPTGAGTFNYQVRDANNCVTGTRSVTITEPALLKIDSVTIGNASCDTMGRMWVHVSGGIAPYRFQLDNGGLQRDSSFKIPANSYQITIRDTNNCMAQQYVTVNQVNNLTYTTPVVAPICEGGSATITPVTNASQFSWSGPRLTPNNAAQSSVTIRPLRDTVYHLVYTLGSCTATDDIPVTVHVAPIPDAGTVNGICAGATAQLNAAPGFAEYHWSPVNYLSNPDVQSPTVTGAPAPGISYFLHVKDANGCSSLIPDTVFVSVTAPIPVFVNPPDTVMYIGDTLHLNAVAAANQFVWTNALGLTPANLTNPNIADPILLVEHNEVLKVHVTDANGCTGDGYFYVRAYQGPEIYVPSAFTPNRDGKNDLLRPACVGVKTLNYFRVFDRWGKIMYEYKGERRGPEVYNLMTSNIGWDGRLDGKELATGTFVWVAEGVTKEGKVITRKGVVTIIR